VAGHATFANANRLMRAGDHPAECLGTVNDQRAFRTDHPLVDVLSGVRRRLKAAAYMILTLKGI